MKKSERLKTYLQWIIDAIEKIETHTKNIDIWSIEQHWLIIDACLMQLINIWEIANRISKKCPNFDKIPIQQMKWLRNFIAHDYLWVNITVIKKILINDLPKLKKDILKYTGKIK